MAKDKYADEMLTEEELECVVGGGPVSLVDDYKFLQEYGLASGYRDFVRSMVFYKASREAVISGWKKAEIRFVEQSREPNIYLQGSPNNKISRDDAYNYVMCGTTFKK